MSENDALWKQLKKNKQEGYTAQLVYELYGLTEEEIQIVEAGGQ